MPFAKSISLLMVAGLISLPMAAVADNYTFKTGAKIPMFNPFVPNDLGARSIQITVNKKLKQSDLDGIAKSFSPNGKFVMATFNNDDGSGKTFIVTFMESAQGDYLSFNLTGPDNLTLKEAIWRGPGRIALPDKTDATLTEQK